MAKRCLTWIVLAALIIAGGLAVGWYVRGHEETIKRNVDGTLAKVTDKLKPAPRQNLTLYTLSPPSRGVFITKISIPLPPANGTVHIPLDESLAQDVRSGQNIILYDAQGQMLNAIGKVIKTSYGEGDEAGKIIVEAELKTAWNVPPDSIARGDIVVQRDAGIARLPLLAIQKDEDGSEYVWESVHSQDGSHTAYRKAATITHRSEDMVGLNLPISSSNVFILNPDKNLEDGQKINAVDVFYAPPSEPNDAIIEATLRTTFPPLPDGRPYDPAEQIYGIKESDYTCPEERAAAQGATASRGISEDFISKIRALSQTLPANP